MFDDFRKKILEAMKGYIQSLNENDLEVDRSGHADYTLKLFRFQKEKDFASIFERVVQKLRSMDFVEKADVEGNYLNIVILGSKMLEVIHSSLEEKQQYPDTFQDPDRVLVEHTSTNPTGPIHIGRARNSIIGDSVSRLLKRYGYRVSTQYFVNDTGKQVMGLYLGYLQSDEKKLDIDSLLAGYRAVYKEIDKDKSKEKELDRLIERYESGERQVVDEVRKICEIMLIGIRDSLKRIGIKVDDYVFESGFLHSEEMEQVLSAVQENTVEDNGALYIPLEDGSKVYIRRKDGTSLYVLRDLAFHVFKSLNYDWLIDVLGEDHRGHMKQLSSILTDIIALRSKLSFVFYSYVNLEGGKMSTRAGNAVTLDSTIDKAIEKSLEIVKQKRPDLPAARVNEIADAVAVSAVRFQMAKVNGDKPITFRWSEALNFEGDSAPYIMYSYARTSKILEKAPDIAVNNMVLEPPEKQLVRTMYLYAPALQASVDSLRIDTIAAYLLDLVRSFNDFYSKCQVIGSGDHEGKRVLILRAYREILLDASKIMGIKLVEEM